MKNLLRRSFSYIYMSSFFLIVTIGSETGNENYPDPSSNPESPLMLSGDWVPENTHAIDFSSLPRVPSEHSIVSDVRYAWGRKINQHNYLVYHEGRLWAMWSDGPGDPKNATIEEHQNITPGHELPGQLVSYSTSKNGINWSEPRDLAGPPDEGFGWIARGFWLREGKLLALATRFNAPSPYDKNGQQQFFTGTTENPGYRGEGLQLHAYEMIEDKGECKCFDWKHKGIVYDNAMNNFPPKKLPTGEWLMSRRDKNGDVHMLAGGVKAFNTWESFHVIGYQGEELKAEEPYWWILPEGKNLVAFFRDNSGSGYLFRAFSTDNGRSWSRLVQTNFPGSASKFNGLRLPDGRYVLVSNANPKGRNELILAISDDGIVFNKMAYLIGERHVDYPHVMVHYEHLYVAFAGAKQSVEVLKIKLSDLDNIDMSQVSSN